MAEQLHARFVASITELKRDPISTALSGQGEAVAILNRSNVAFYCVPPNVFEDMVRRLSAVPKSPSPE